MTRVDDRNLMTGRFMFSKLQQRRSTHRRPQWTFLHAAGRIGRRSGVLLALASLHLAVSGACWAADLPEMGNVTRGKVNIDRSDASRMVLTQADKLAAISWQSFDIRQGATLEVRQPSHDAILVNRVTGAQPSTISGQLSADGMVVLINPNGMSITPEANVRAAGFLVSNQDMLDVENVARKWQELAGLIDHSTAQGVNLGNTQDIHTGTKGDASSRSASQNSSKPTIYAVRNGLIAFLDGSGFKLDVGAASPALPALSSASVTAGTSGTSTFGGNALTHANRVRSGLDLPAIPSLPGAPVVSSLPGAPTLPGAASLPVPGALPSLPSAAMPALPSLPSVPSVPSVDALPGILSVPGLPSFPGIPSLSPVLSPGGLISYLSVKYLLPSWAAPVAYVADPPMRIAARWLVFRMLPRNPLGALAFGLGGGS